MPVKDPLWSKCAVLNVQWRETFVDREGVNGRAPSSDCFLQSVQLQEWFALFCLRMVSSLCIRYIDQQPDKQSCSSQSIAAHCGGIGKLRSEQSQAITVAKGGYSLDPQS